jgi:archaellum component FlaF (FlaF/FlaG flagellin family)
MFLETILVIILILLIIILTKLYTTKQGFKNVYPINKKNNDPPTPPLNKFVTISGTSSLSDPTSTLILLMEIL